MAAQGKKRISLKLTPEQQKQRRPPWPDKREVRVGRQASGTGGIYRGTSVASLAQGADGVLPSLG